MSFKPLVINAGKVEQLQAGQALNVGWDLPSGPTADNQVLQATGSGVASWTTDVQGLSSVVTTKLGVNTGYPTVAYVAQFIQNSNSGSFLATAYFSCEPTANCTRSIGLWVQSVTGSGKIATTYAVGIEGRAIVNVESPDVAPQAIGLKFNAENRRTGTITHAKAIDAAVMNYDAGSTGTIVNAYGVYVDIHKGAGSITTAYGVYIETMDATTSYGVYVKNKTAIAADNQPAFFGAGLDASIYYDGTNLAINPKVVGSGILDVLGTLQTDGYNSADGTAGASSTVTCGLADVVFKNGLYVGHTLSGKAITVTAKVTSVTLTAAELVGGIVTDNTTVAGDTLTLPTGTAMDTELPSYATGESIVWSVINLDGTYPVAISAGSGHSIIGTTTIAASSQAGFTSVRSGANTWVSYRTA